jgi:hypothetical protein
MVEGNTLYGEINHALGEPENPIPGSATMEKFRAAAGSFLSKKGMDRIEGMLEVSGTIEPAQGLFEVVSENIHTM